jgi:hypothetical protein
MSEIGIYLFEAPGKKPGDGEYHYHGGGGSSGGSTESTNTALVVNTHLQKPVVIMPTRLPTPTVTVTPWSLPFS